MAARSSNGRGPRRSQALISTGLFVVMGAVAAFVVSAVAEHGDEAPAAATELRTVVPGTEDRSSVRVEVLNGAGVGGLARDATHHLRDDGFDVVFFGNAGRFDHTRSVVIDRTGDRTRARDVAAALGVDSVATAIDSSLMLEVTVILGQDWPPPAPAPEPDWAERILDLVTRDTVPGPAAPADSNDSTTRD